jgi:hypothetical protein
MIPLRKSVALLVGLQLTLAVTAFAQDSDDKLSVIKAPQSPAASILSLQPATISRPKSWQTLETALFSNFANNGNLAVPNDFALEFSPYWAGKRKVDINEFLVPSPLVSVQQNLSFSLASTTKFMLPGNIASNAVSLGARTMIWQGTKNETTAIMTAYRDVMDGLGLSNRIFRIADNIGEGHEDKRVRKTKFVDTLMLVIKKNRDQVFKDLEFSSRLGGRKAEVIDMWIDMFRAHLLKKFPDVASWEEFAELTSDATDEFIKVDQAIASVTELQKDRKGFKLEVASAMILNFPTNETNYSAISKWGFWLTPSFQPFDTENFEFLGVARFFWYDQQFYQSWFPNTQYYNSNFDYGARFVYKKHKYSIEFEATGRRSDLVLSRTVDPQGIITTSKKVDKDFQYLVNFNYRLTDQLMVSYNFGKQFEPRLSINGSLISLLTLNYGLGAPTTKDIKK